MFAQTRWPALTRLQEALTQLVWPIQQAVDIPFNVVEQSQLFLSERLNLLEENTNLQRQQVYLQAQIQKLSALEAENLELRELLQSVGQDIESFSEARLINADTDPFSQKIILNKGKNQGVQIGQPVIDSHGLVGIVVSMEDQTSKVLLLTDPGFAVPVQSVRSGERAIAVGSGAGGELRLSYVPRTADFVEGDQLVTSGIGGRFPVGYPVGTITSIQHDPSTRFTVIGISPNAKVGQFRHVLLVKHHNRVALEEATLAKVKPKSNAGDFANTLAQSAPDVVVSPTEVKNALAEKTDNKNADVAKNTPAEDETKTADAATDAPKAVPSKLASQTPEPIAPTALTPNSSMPTMQMIQEQNEQATAAAVPSATDAQKAAQAAAAQAQAAKPAKPKAKRFVPDGQHRPQYGRGYGPGPDQPQYGPGARRFSEPARTRYNEPRVRRGDRPNNQPPGEE